MPTTDPDAQVTIGSVAATIRFEDLSESITSEGPSASVVFQCPYDSRFDLIAGLAGGSKKDDTGKIVYTTPYAYPFGTNMYVREIPRIVGIGKPKRRSDGWPTWDIARVSATFGVPRWGFDATTGDLSGRPWTTTRCRVNAEVVVPPGGTFYYSELPEHYSGNVDNGKPLREGQAGLIHVVNEFTVTRHWMPYIPLEEIDALIGTVNDVDTLVGDHLYEDGQLLFAAFDYTETIDMLGKVVYECSYTVLAKTGERNTWNAVLDSSAVQHIINTEADESGEYPYKYSDFWYSLP